MKCPPRHCFRIRDHKKHSWRGRDWFGVRTHYWCDGKPVIDGGTRNSTIPVRVSI